MLSLAHDMLTEATTRYRERGHVRASREHATHSMGTAMGPSGKWIDGINPEASVVDAARLSLAARLTAVAHWLPLAAYHATQDVEHVHRLRVSTRRAVAALRLYGDWLRPKHYRWVKRRLKKIRRAAGEARDLDVLAERLRREAGERAAPILDHIEERRAAAQPAIIEVAEKCRRDDCFVRKIGKLLDSVRPPDAECHNGQPVRFRDWARKQLAAAAEAFFADMPIGSRDPAALHEFRIRGKAVRYAIELLAPAFGPELRDDFYPIVEKLQERLGAVNDHVTAGQRLREWHSGADNPEHIALYDELIAREEADVPWLTEEFHQWWTTERIESLKSGLTRAALGEAATTES